MPELNRGSGQHSLASVKGASPACAEAEHVTGLALGRMIVERGLPETEWLVSAIVELRKARQLCADGREKEGLLRYGRVGQLTRELAPDWKRRG